MAIQLLVKRGVAANRPTLLAGEFYYATDSQQLFVGSTPVRCSTILASVDLTAQGAAVVTTTLFTPVVSGVYEIDAALKVTRAATTSSTLGAVTIAYTDADDSVAQSQLFGMLLSTGILSNTVATNSTTSRLNGKIIINAKAGVAVTYAIAYVSSGATTMQYSAHLRVKML